MKQILNVSVAECSYLSSYKLTNVNVAVPVNIVSTQNELNAEVGFLATNENIYANGKAPKINNVTKAIRATKNIKLTYN